jgi:hypothetical protein
VILNNGSRWRQLGLNLFMWTVPVLALVMTLLVANNNDLMKTEKSLAQYVAKQPQVTEASNFSRWYYLTAELEFSARFYSHDLAKPVQLDQLDRLAKQQQGVFVAVPLSRWETTSAHFGARLEPRIQNMRFKLAYLQP